VIVNNLGTRDANNRTSWGGRLTVSPKDNPDVEAGVSYYGGQWDSQGNNMFQMGNAHLHAQFGGFDLLSEYLILDTEGDQGFITHVGVPDWRTTGYFAQLSYKIAEVFGKPLTPWVRYEEYISRGLNGGVGREKEREPAGGLTLQATENLALKFEASHLSYVLPFASQGQIKVRADTYQFGAAFTF
jgi:hypothetical protein